jgi:hypothetical protein
MLAAPQRERRGEHAVNRIAQTRCQRSAYICARMHTYLPLSTPIGRRSPRRPACSLRCCAGPRLRGCTATARTSGSPLWRHREAQLCVGFREGGRRAPPFAAPLSFRTPLWDVPPYTTAMGVAPSVFVVVNTLASSSTLDSVISTSGPELVLSTWSYDGASRSNVVTKLIDRAFETLTTTARAWVRQRLLASRPRLQMRLITHTSNIPFARTAGGAPNLAVGDTAAPHLVLIGSLSHSNGLHSVSAQWAPCRP